MQMNGLSLTEVLPGRDAQRLLGRREEDALILAFARWAEAKIRRWVDFRYGALLLLAVPGDSESGALHLFDRTAGSFWLIEIAGDGRWSGYREDEFDALVQTHGLKDLAQNPRRTLAAAAA